MALYMARACGLPHTVDCRFFGRWRRCPLHVTGANKGFGNIDKPNKDNDDDSSPRTKKKRVRTLSPRGPRLPTSDESLLQTTSLRNVEELEEQLQKQAEDEEFSKRLALMRAQGEQRTAKAQDRLSTSSGALDASPFAGSPASTSTSSGDSLSSKDDSRSTRPTSTSASATPTPATTSSIYDNPPSLASTLLGQLESSSDVSDPKLRAAQFGPGTLPLAAGAVIFALVYVLVSGGDMNPSRRSSPRPAQAPPDPIEERLLKTQAGELEEELKQRPDDPDVLEPLALTYAKLFQFDDAADRVERLLAKRPNDINAWRILGESALLANQPSRSVTAYEKAAQLSATALGNGPQGAPSLQILTGLVDACVADGQQSKAEAVLTKLVEQLPTSAATAGGQKVAPATATSPAPALPATTSGTPPAVPVPSSSSSSSSSAPAAQTVDAVNARLLLGKLYSGWRGHDAAALAVYDRLVELFPEDYRGFLACGVYLKTQGKRAESDRMFLQANFYAPGNRKALVKSMSNNNPVLDLPENN